MDITEMLRKAQESGASDIFIIAGLPLSYKVNGVLKELSETNLLPADTQDIIEQIYVLAGNRDISHFEEHGDDDFSFAVPGMSRFRVSTYKQRGSMAAVVRVIAFSLPHPYELGISENIIRLVDANKGLILVTGPAGSGKSTTLACMVDHINSTRENHIITLEDPLEFLHKHKKSIVSQREISTDTDSYIVALRAALRQSPDVILLGEMRDYETIQTAMTAAETGHLVLSSLHTIGAANTIDRIIDVFPPNQQRQITVQLAMVLNAVVSQQLVPATDGTLIPAFEVMTLTPAIRNMIRDGKLHEIDGVIYSSASADMIAMDTSLLNLVRQNRITKLTAVKYASNPEMLEKKLKMI